MLHHFYARNGRWHSPRLLHCSTLFSSCQDLLSAKVFFYLVWRHRPALRRGQMARGARYALQLHSHGSHIYPT